MQLEGIERDPLVFDNAARIVGTRIPVFFIEDIFRLEGGGLEAVADAYPQLSRADIFAALSYAEVFPDAVASDRKKYLSRAERSRRT